MLKYFVVVCTSILLFGCATTPYGLRKQEVDFTLNKNNSNLLTLSECILRKVEPYPILIGFGFEGLTLPVQIRQFSDKAELFQMQNTYITTLIELHKRNNSKINADLYVAKEILSYDRTVKAYSKFIQECYHTK